MHDVQLRFRADPRHVGRCRRWAVRRATEQGASPEAVRLVELLTSEVVTNAVKYGPADGQVTLRVRRDGDEVLVAVRDESAVPPEVLHPEPTRFGGRGMGLVESLARDWGVHQHHADGKSVWFRLPLRPPAALTAA